MITTLKAYYKTPHWKGITAPLLKADDTVCAICGRPHWHIYKNKPGKRLARKFNIHHVSYDNIGREKKGDVVPLCYSCHMMGHDLEKISRAIPHLRPVYDLLVEITGIAFPTYKGEK